MTDRLQPFEPLRARAMRRPRLYLSGPITLGNRTINFSTACCTQAKFMQDGFAVLNPMLTMLHPDAWTIDHEVWLACDLPWVEAADLVFRLPGESKGADMETAHAREHGVPVIDSYHALKKWKEAWDAK